MVKSEKFKPDEVFEELGNEPNVKFEKLKIKEAQNIRSYKIAVGVLITLAAFYILSSSANIFYPSEQSKTVFEYSFEILKLSGVFILGYFFSPKKSKD